MLLSGDLFTQELWDSLSQHKAPYGWQGLSRQGNPQPLPLAQPLASAGPFLLLFALMKNRPPCPHRAVMWEPCVPVQGGPQRSIPKLRDSCFTLGLRLHPAALNILRLPWHEKLRNQCPKVAKHRGHEAPNSLLTFAAGGNHHSPLPLTLPPPPHGPDYFLLE